MLENTDAAVPIIALKGQTGLTPELVRKWETRYGFPRPARDENGDRIYPPEQVMCLRLIRRLLGAGMRPGKIVGLDLAALEHLSQQLAPPEAANADRFSERMFEALVRHDPGGLESLFRERSHQVGLALFVREIVSVLSVQVGEAWLLGKIKVFEEHLFTETVEGILRDAIRAVAEAAGSPHIMLTTPPDELHMTGLLGANIEMLLHGARCVRLGPQTPAAEIKAAADAYGIDIVGLSFSAAYPARDVARFLRDLRKRLAAPTEVWAGGQGVRRLPRIKGVVYFHSLDEIGPAIHAWKACHPPNA